MRDDRNYLQDILERIDLTTTFIAGDLEALAKSRMMQEAVIRNLEVMGEASRHISPSLQEQYPQVPWKEIAAFRNVAIHAYWNINLERVIQIIEQDLPPLKIQIEEILRLFADKPPKD